MNEDIKRADVKFLCHHYFNVVLTPKQEEIVRAIAFRQSNRIVISCMTRYGKSFSVAMGVLLYILFNPNKRILLIAPIKEQTGILRNYVADFALRHVDFINLIELDVEGIERMKKEVSRSRITFRNGSSLQVLSAEGKATRLMGHGGDLVLLDETALINPDTYREKISRMLGDKKDAMLVEIGNPWSKDSHMYEHWTDDRFLKIHVDWHDAVREGRVAQGFIDEQKKLLSDNEFKVLYEADFPDTLEDALIKWEWVQKAKKISVLTKGKKELMFGLDVAEAGRDFNVLTGMWKQGNNYKLEFIEYWHQADTEITVNKVSEFVKRYKPSKVFVDATGVGKGVADGLAHLHDGIVQVKVGMAPNLEKDRFLNIKAQYYWRLRTLFEDGQIELPDIANREKLTKELSLMKYEKTSSEKIRIIDPKTKSPDFSDSCMLAVCSGADWNMVMLSDDKGLVF